MKGRFGFDSGPPERLETPSRIGLAGCRRSSICLRDRSTGVHLCGIRYCHRSDEEKQLQKMAKNKILVEKTPFSRFGQKSNELAAIAAHRPAHHESPNN